MNIPEIKQIKNNSSFHLVGILGIGMSGLAQMLNYMGYSVSGSDRGLGLRENEEIVKKLRLLGITIYQQDGSFVKAGNVDFVVYSSAIEADNPDFIAGKNIKKLHRTEVLSIFFEKIMDKKIIAVAGTCGKTSVSSMIAETFDRLGLDPFALSGGYINFFKDQGLIGNFKAGSGEYTIFESDESDKSLLNFRPDYSVLLNIGSDHYSKEELVSVFEKFLFNTKVGAVVEESLLKILSPKCYEHLNVIPFSASEHKKSIWSISSYTINNQCIKSVFSKGNINYKIDMPVPGRYNANNFLSVIALYELLNMENSVTVADFFDSLSRYRGVHRRFEFVGLENKTKTKVYCDFAHNVQKIKSAIECAKSLTSSRVFAVFQPHGYKPLSDMAYELYLELEKILSNKDNFIFVPVYYAGGTTSFKPKSSDVVESYKKMSKGNDRYKYFETRDEVNLFFEKNCSADDLIIIMGARDNSLPLWCDEIVEKV